MEETYVHVSAMNVRKTVNMNLKHIKSISSDIEDAEEIVDLLKYKQQLIDTMLDMIPLGHVHCPYCLIYDRKCHKCSYGHKHTECGDINSTYLKLLGAVEDVTSLIMNIYSFIPSRIKHSKSTFDYIKEKLLLCIVSTIVNTSNHIMNMEKATSAAEFLQYKAIMMHDILYGLPIGASTCYFCHEHPDCTDCELGNMFGVCTLPSSYYYKLKDKIQDLHKVIDEYANI